MVCTPERNILCYLRKKIKITIKIELKNYVLMSFCILEKRIFLRYCKFYYDDFQLNNLTYTFS